MNVIMKSRMRERRTYGSVRGLWREPLVYSTDKEELYMKKSISRIIGLTMLIIAIVFIMFALNHPEKSFPWSNTITWLLYGVYFLVTVVLLIVPKIKK